MSCSTVYDMMYIPCQYVTCHMSCRGREGGREARRKKQWAAHRQPLTPIHSCRGYGCHVVAFLYHVRYCITSYNIMTCHGVPTRSCVILQCLVVYSATGVCEKTLLRRRRPLGKVARTTPNLGLERRFMLLLCRATARANRVLLLFADVGMSGCSVSYRVASHHVAAENLSPSPDYHGISYCHMLSYQ